MTPGQRVVVSRGARWCSWCQQRRPRDHWGRNRARIGGREGWCKPRKAAYARGLRRRRAETDPAFRAAEAARMRSRRAALRAGWSADDRRAKGARAVERLLSGGWTVDDVARAAGRDRAAVLGWRDGSVAPHRATVERLERLVASAAPRRTGA